MQTVNSTWTHRQKISNQICWHDTVNIHLIWKRLMLWIINPCQNYLCFCIKELFGILWMVLKQPNKQNRISYCCRKKEIGCAIPTPIMCFLKLSSSSCGLKLLYSIKNQENQGKMQNFWCYDVFFESSGYIVVKEGEITFNCHLTS